MLFWREKKGKKKKHSENNFLLCWTIYYLIQFEPIMEWQTFWKHFRWLHFCAFVVKSWCAVRHGRFNHDISMHCEHFIRDHITLYSFSLKLAHFLHFNENSAIIFWPICNSSVHQNSSSDGSNSAKSHLKTPQWNVLTKYMLQVNSEKHIAFIQF